MREIAEAARWFDRHPLVKVVVVSGQGRSFSAGADLGAFDGNASGAEGSARDNADLGRLMADAVEAMNAITIARVHGHCIGGGLVLAAACDLRVAASDAYFSIPEVDLGIPLAWGGIPRLVREIGPALTKELVMTCRPFTSAEAHAAGFLNRVVASADLDQEVEEPRRAAADEVAVDTPLDEAACRRGDAPDGRARSQLGRCRQPRRRAPRSRVASECQGLSRQSEEEVTTPIDDVLDDLVAEYDRLESILESLSDTQWRSESAAPGWTVTDVMIHLAQTEEGVVGHDVEAERAEPPDP